MVFRYVDSFAALASSTRILSQESIEGYDLARLARCLGGASPRVALVIDNSFLVARSRVIDNLLHEDLAVSVFDQVIPNPSSKNVMAALARFRSFAPTIVVGFGGGSVLDAAKAIAIMMENEGHLDEYLGSEATRTLAPRRLPLVLLPTTSGTGAEVTRFGVYTARSGRKYTLVHPGLQADVAILAAEQTASLPPELTAATGFDALSHALETLWNRKATPQSNVLAHGAAVAVLRHLPAAYEAACTGRCDLPARQALLEAACWAGVAFNLTGTAAVHALSFILSEEWNVPHGMACAFTLEDILRLNALDEISRGKLAEVAMDAIERDALGADPVEALAGRIQELKSRMGLPRSFSDLGVSVTESSIEQQFARAFDDPKMANNPIQDRNRIFNILKAKIA